MMGVYINGMEMSKSCSVCRLFGEYGCLFIGAVGYALTRGERNEDCPIIEVPEPHGDLIGREWLVDISLHLMNIAKNDDIANGVKWLWQYIIEAPTIIPASEESE